MAKIVDDGGEAQAAPPIETISESQLTAFFNAQATDYVCQSCGHDEFDYFSNPDRSPAMAQFFIAREKDHQVVGFVPCVLLHCVQCGYMIQFYWHTISGWLREQRGGGV